MSIVKEFFRCPLCNNTGKISSLINGYAGFHYTRCEFVADMHNITFPQVRRITKYYDMCDKCGFEYCVRVDEV